MRFIFPKCGWSGVFKNPSGTSCFHGLFVRIDILIILHLIRGYQLWLIKKGQYTDFVHLSILPVLWRKSLKFPYFCMRNTQEPMNEINAVCVYCASSTKIDKVYFDAAEDLGRLLGERNIRLVNGAGSIGLMRAVSDATLAAGGKVTGVIPGFMVEQGWQHNGLTELIEVESMHERKRTMAALSDAVIALPGGVGTLEELLEIITWKQLGLYLNPVVILNIKGYFDPLLEMLGKAIEENFMRRQHGDIWVVVNTPEDAMEAVYQTHVWDESIRKFAAV